MSLYEKLKSRVFPDNAPSREGFTPQFRFEGRSRDPDNQDNLAMRVADPLWMLGRQWQFGEFQGEDNGSPIHVVARFKKDRIRHFSFFSNPKYHPLDERIPLEAAIEAMPIAPLDLRSRARIGQQFERIVARRFEQSEAQRWIARLRADFGWAAAGRLDAESKRFLQFIQVRALDGGQLWANLRQGLFPGTEYAPLRSAAQELEAWYAALFLQPAQTGQSAWDSKELAHRFKLHLTDQQHPDNLTLDAPDYQSGHLDWYSFDRVEALKGQGSSQEFQDSPRLSPVNIAFSGMPEKRLFAFEDSKFDLGRVEAEPADLMRMMLIDFSLISGNDWFIVPLEMKPGELCWIKHVEVTDVFGVKTKIVNDANTGMFLSADPTRVWDTFKIRDNNPALYDAEEAKRHFLFLMPAAPAHQESPPLEDILFLRDEYANMVWALEKTVSNSIGRSVNGYDLHLELNGPFLKPTGAEEGAAPYPQYRLATTVPTNWIPYLPVHAAGSYQEIELRRAMMVRNEALGEPEPIVPLSWLAREELRVVREEAVPRAGIRVQLTRQRVRWMDGKTYIWMGRKVAAGRGEGSSGLHFDSLKS
jgi:hypothetical protein